MRPDDLSNLEVLDENTIVQALRGRFHKEKYYVSKPTQLQRNTSFFS